MNCGTGRNPDKDSLVSANALSHRKSVFIADWDDFIINALIQYRRDKTCANPLNFVRTCNASGKNGRRSRFYSNDFDIGVLSFQIFADTGNRAAGADTGNEKIDCTIGILPDFRPVVLL